MNDHTGQQLGNYILIRKLGQGGFGEVWLDKASKSYRCNTSRGLSVIWNVPYHRNMFFTGREQVLASLHDTFCS